MNETEWEALFSKYGLAIELDEHIIIDIIKILFIPDDINSYTFTNNYLVLMPNPSNNISPLQLQEFYGIRDKNDTTTTPSISHFLSPAKRAPAFPLWFLAAYPDVMYWFYKEQKDLFEKNTGKTDRVNNEVADIIMEIWGMDKNKALQLDNKGNLFDNNRKYHPKALRILINSYLMKTGKSLEVSTIDSLKESFVEGSLILGNADYTKETSKNELTDNNVDLSNVSEGTIIIDGSTYVGQLKNDMPHGKGKQVWPDGHSYEGEYKDYMFHGNGVYKWPSGEVYEGQWQNNLFHGKGTYYYNSGKIKKGLWREDDYIGVGTEDNYNKLDAYETDIKGVRQIQPWPRHLARATDIVLFVLSLSYGLIIIAPNLYNSLLISGFIYPFNLLALITIEALMLTSWGTTPGKYLFAISVTDNDGDLLSLISALSRSFQVYLKGTGLGLPIISIIALIISYRTLVYGKWGKTTWDYKGGYRVHHDKITPERKVLLVLIWLSIIISFSLFGYIF